MAAIPLLAPHLAGNERQYIGEALDANEIALGSFVERFEEAFAEYVGSRHAVAVSSGTAALHLALRLLGVGPGDEVLAPTFSFVASVNPILYQGAIPVLVDAERQTWGMDYTLIMGEIKRRVESGRPMPKALILAHLYGHPAWVYGIQALCEAYGIQVIEDASEALGATVDGFHVGTFGKIGCFSFNGNKIITTGGGGMLVTDDERLAARARHLRGQARLAGSAYDHDEVGHNYRLSNLQAAVGLAQLEQLPEIIERKRALADIYDRWLTPAPRAAWAYPTFWLYSTLVEEREAVRLALVHKGIEARPLWTPIHTMKPYRDYRVIGGSVAEHLHANGISLPSSVGLKYRDQATIIDVVLSSLDKKGRSALTCNQT